MVSHHSLKPAAQRLALAVLATIGVWALVATSTARAEPLCEQPEPPPICLDDPRPRPPAPSPPVHFKVMAWNINESVSGRLLDRAAAAIRDQNPDVVLLSEVMWRRWVAPWSPEANPTRYLAQRANLPFYEFGQTTVTGAAGGKGVAILSRYALHDVRMHVTGGSALGAGGTGALEATIFMGGRGYRFFSARYAPLHVGDYTMRAANEEGHMDAMRLVRAVPAATPVIFGGDLNAWWEQDGPDWHNWTDAPWARYFRDHSGLADALQTRPGGAHPSELANRVDYIYYRGGFRVGSFTSTGVADEQAFDHPYHVARFES